MPTSTSLPRLKCRPEQFAGLWLCEPSALANLQSAVENIITSGQLPAVTAASDELDDVDAANGYTVSGDGIATVPVEGTLTKYPTSFRSRLGGSSTLVLQRVFGSILADPMVKGVMVSCDSPGGLLNGIDELSALISKVNSIKPVLFHVHGLGTSAMYRLAAEGSHISADPSAIVGSIGAMTSLNDTTELAKRAGVDIHYFASGPEKLDGAPGKPITQEMKDRRQAYIDTVGQQFVSTVAKARKLTPENIATVAKAGIFTAQQGKDLGLVDSIGFTEDALATLRGLIQAKQGTASQLDRSGNVFNQPIDTFRRATMLTPEQLATAKTLPGCGHITAENADTVLLAAATSLQNVAGNAANQVTQLATELTQARAQASGNAPMSPRELGLSAKLASAMLAPLSGTKLAPACVEGLTQALIGTEGSFNAAALVPDAKGDCLATKVIAALGQNTLELPAAGGKTTIQPQPRTAPGTEDQGNKVYTLEQVNAVRAAANCPPLTALPGNMPTKSVA